MNLRNFAILALLVISPKLFAQDPNFYIFLCFGQSNMEGQGVVEAQDTIVDPRFQVMQSYDCPEQNWVKGTWRVAEPPLCHCYPKISPADYFGRTMVTNLPDSIKIGVIVVAVGGCDIRLFDKRIYKDYRSTYEDLWYKEKIKSYNGNPYQYLIDLAANAQKDGVIKGILLHQGETNSGDSLWPEYVNTIYKDMLSDLSLSAGQVPLLSGELLHGDSTCCDSMNAIINTLPSVIPTAHVISSEGCTGQDIAHFTSEGYRILGKRYAIKMLDIMGIKLE